MKRINVFFAVAILATGIFTACKSNDCPVCDNTVVEKDGGVVINGVCWAKCNVGTFGTFVSKPTDYGMLYQWNRKTAYDNTTAGAVTGWDATYPKDSVWVKANDPSPAGWRVPTVVEIATLLEKDKMKNEWVEVDGVFGTKFTDLSTNKSIFLPAAGYRSYLDGTLFDVGSGGYYWSSTGQSSIYAYHLYIDRVSAGLNGNDEAFGFSVRPVAE